MVVAGYRTGSSGRVAGRLVVEEEEIRQQVRRRRVWQYGTSEGHANSTTGPIGSRGCHYNYSVGTILRQWFHSHVVNYVNHVN